MPIDPRKRQRKLERRKAKQKAEKKALARQESLGIGWRLEQATNAPVLHCCTSADIWEKGIGHVLLSRQLSNGQVAFVSFLVDLYCLGVKDVIMQVAPRGFYQERMYDKLAGGLGATPLKPACARKLVEGAVQYALALGLPPHHDYETAAILFGDISAEACTEQYTYGKDGKPFFIAGPYDGPARCKQILRALEAHTGPAGHHFLMRIDKETAEQLEVIPESLE